MYSRWPASVSFPAPKSTDSARLETIFCDPKVTLSWPDPMSMSIEPFTYALLIVA